MTDIIDTTIQAGSLNTLVTAIETASLVNILKGTGPFTLFAPTDDAFGKLPKGVVNELLKDISKLKKILAYHVLTGKVMAAAITKMKTIKTVESSKIKINVPTDTKNIKVNDSIVTTFDVAADNGVIHIIDTVLTPASILL
ncbi:fasciclin domain-containing protein [Leptothoe spongobia]|uniref:Fasciclin domain-containing protein n=1 Tax=Leptothoe spongobia TAU-MAC 1115 TaxID=1967444 RepID=A0A947DHA1_9CYAN|nr:fasciclin domain-containing protein [Leptothoe spongobia]MBT9316624.1 fasciclin domain-containing protein [Leptothoe spongobia TAU-MAC 1115]